MDDRVDEAGRVLSAANAGAIVTAWRALGALLSRALGATPQDEGDTAESVREALSHGDTERALALALRSVHPVPGDGYWLWVQDVFDASVVYRYETPAGATLFQRDYALTDAGAVSFGDPVEVMQRTEYVRVSPTSEAQSLRSDLVALAEAALRDDGTVPIRIIAPGWGSSGYYAPAMLERDGPRVFTAGLHMYLDHPSVSEADDRPERSVRDLAGRLVSDARWDANGPAGPGLYADAEVFAPYRDVIGEIAPHIGVSIRASGAVTEGEAEGRKGRLVDRLVGAESVDWVTRAGAGGQVVTMLESARAARAARTDEPAIVSPAETRGSEGDDMDDLTEATARIAELEAENERLVAAQMAGATRARVAERLAAVELPAFATRRITEGLADIAPVTDAGQLDAAIDAAVATWRADLAGMTEAGTGVTGMGPSGGADASAQLEAALGNVMGVFGLSQAGREIAVRGR